MKICSYCKEEKLDTDFWPRNTRKPGSLNSQCKRCNYTTRHEIRRANKIKLIELLGGSCQRCGHTSSTGVSLSIDHRQSSAVSYKRRKSILAWKWERIVAEVKAGNCWLVCLNCHAEVEHERGYLGRNFWRVLGNGPQPVLNTGVAAAKGSSPSPSSISDEEDLEGCPI